jgi:hypothetical protein
MYMPVSFRTFALAVLCLFPSAAFSEVKIPAKFRIKNQPPGRCGWCALETLARFHHLKALYGLTEKNASRARPPDLEASLEDAGVPYRIQYPGDHDTAILRYAIDHNLGAVVGFEEAFPGAGRHIVTLIDFSDDRALVIDPNDADTATHTMDRERFLRWWDGFALVIKVKTARR